jgi:hypothetical protein
MSEPSFIRLTGLLLLLVALAAAGGFAGAPTWKWALSAGILGAELLVVVPLALVLWRPWRCPGCRRFNRSDATLCKGCGATHPRRSWPCLACGAANPTRAEVCLDCAAPRPR